MIICKTVEAIQRYLSIQKKMGKTVGLVPTMGALHAGHLALISLCQEKAAITVCSIFVNPTQFNDIADFEKYPVTIENDIRLLEKAGCDFLLLPSVAEMYPTGFSNLPNYELGFIETVLEGKFRQGHFQGVCQIVHRLLQIIDPSILVMGQKDYQQCMVINKLIAITKCNVQLIIVNTLRESSGLAMSSRNMRLSPQDWQQASIIYQSLLYIKENIAIRPIEELIATVNAMLLQNSFSAIDYVSICNAVTLQTETTWNKNTPLVALVAAYIGGVRLIDNWVLN